jgi:hypothetical protein
MDKNKEQEVNFEEIDKLVNDIYAQEDEETTEDEGVQIELPVAEEPTVEVETPAEVEEVKEDPKKARSRKSSKKEEEDPVEEVQEPDSNCDQSEPKRAWIDVFTENYLGKSAVSQEIEDFMKENYKGNPYLPWATMERITYQLDPKARFTNICNRDGGLVHSDIIILEQSSKTNEKEVVSSAPMMSHMVKVTLEFMGRVFIEDYPIQDTDYSAAKIFNQNLVNRALQRAKARVAARATGVGLKLYEGQDLQFEPKGEPIATTTLTKEEVARVAETQKATKATPAKTSTVTETKKVELTEEQKAQNIVDGGDTKAFAEGERTFEPQGTIVKTTVTEASAGVMEIVNLIKKGDEAKVNSVMQRVNVSLIKKYHFGLSRTDSEADLINKIAKFPDADKFKQSLINLGIE